MKQQRKLKPIKSETFNKLEHQYVSLTFAEQLAKLLESKEAADGDHTS